MKAEQGDDQSSMALPIRVAELAEVICTLTVEPIRAEGMRSKTTVLFWLVRPTI